MKMVIFVLVHRTASLVIILLLSGCAGLPTAIPFLQTPAPPSSPQPTATPFSLDPTNTPDLFVLNTLEPTTTALAEGAETTVVTSTPIPLPTSTPTIRSTITLEPIGANLFTPSPNLFLSVQRS